MCASLRLHNALAYNGPGVAIAGLWEPSTSLVNKRCGHTSSLRTVIRPPGSMSCAHLIREAVVLMEPQRFEFRFYECHGVSAERFRSFANDLVRERAREVGSDQSQMCPRNFNGI